MNVVIDTPYLSVEEYARRTGMTERSVRERCIKGQLPVRKRRDGERFFVNNALLMKEALEAGQ